MVLVLIVNGFGRNSIIFSSVHVDNKKKDILTLPESPTQGLDGTTFTAEKIFNQLY